MKSLPSVVPMVSGNAIFPLRICDFLLQFFEFSVRHSPFIFRKDFQLHAEQIKTHNLIPSNNQQAIILQISWYGLLRMVALNKAFNWMMNDEGFLNVQSEWL